MPTSKTPVTRAEFTLRNKKNSPIQTLAAHALSEFLKARPDSVSLVLAKYQADYKRLTGKSVKLTYEQENQLLVRFGANAKQLWSSPYSELGAELSAVRNCFQAGFLARTCSAGLLADLAIAEEFFDMLDRYRPAQGSAST